MDSLQQVSKQTKVKMRLAQLSARDSKKAQSRNAVTAKRQGISPTQAIRSEGGIYGQFVLAKQMVFDEEKGNAPAFVDEKRQKTQGIVDYTAKKKGLNYHGTERQALERENREIEHERQLKEKADELFKEGQQTYNEGGGAGGGFGKADEEKKAAEAKESKAETKTEAGGDEGDEKGGSSEVLKMAEVQALPDDVDAIVKQMKGVDFGAQDLDVLIELSKQLKYKRLGLFPDTNYMVSL